jgi:hypothetical protein
MKHKTLPALSETDRSDALVKWHQHHLGLYSLVARKLKVDASYVSLVASGDRHSARIRDALIHELERIDRQYR